MNILHADLNVRKQKKAFEDDVTLKAAWIQRVKQSFADAEQEKKIFRITLPEIRLFLFESGHENISVEESQALLHRYVSDRPGEMDFSTIDVVRAEIQLILAWYSCGIPIPTVRNKTQETRIRFLIDILKTVIAELEKMRIATFRMDSPLKSEMHLSIAQYAEIRSAIDRRGFGTNLSTLRIFRAGSAMEDAALEDICVEAAFMWSKRIR